MTYTCTYIYMCVHIFVYMQIGIDIDTHVYRHYAFL